MKDVEQARRALEEIRALIKRPHELDGEGTRHVLTYAADLLSEHLAQWPEREQHRLYLIGLLAARFGNTLAAPLSKLVQHFAVEAANTANLAGVTAQLDFLLHNGMPAETLLTMLRTTLNLDEDDNNYVIIENEEAVSVPSTPEESL